MALTHLLARMTTADDTLIDSLPTLRELIDQTVELFDDFRDQIFSITAVWQALAILGAILIGFFLSQVPRKKLEQLASESDNTNFLFRLYHSLSKIVWPLIAVILLWAATALFEGLELPNDGLRIAASLMNAWIIVRVITSNMKDGIFSTTLAICSWVVAALFILRLIDPVSDALDGMAMSIGDFRISVLSVLTSAFVAGLALWIGRIMGDAVQTQLKGSKSLTPSMAGLLGQFAKIGLMVLAVMIALNAVGVNLTALTVFSGALGVGIGFGLQAILSNFMSGVIILFEKTVKVGDFIELQSGVNGVVKEINIRSTLVTTNDNVDILVPNEEFIKSRVTNWTLKETARRLRLSFGVAYGTDKELVRKAGLEAAEDVQWTVKGIDARAAQVWLTGFGDSSLDFELVVWLKDDAVSRPARVQADYYWALHTALEKYDIEIPFPQRDINFRNSSPVRVQIENAPAPEKEGE
ncbi:mechanosensitive ion channel domain-containing protein [Ponticaulis sp.]|uniref:mechanosensitive ion channel family protein n=1 Tax=Ponticaulis sp. TaxID=2020902 RepID=UPI000B63C656|nr:mechanosensitive ion channel domain-containing protein [Ponticaulis sp.]MAJ09980.1 mechanosensitive ion channel protein MscS [Ponticaulis sp.]|tara:strand:- start:6218 stop:7621 length:1404 start_codon:yes stop_codon:yes gene_type:complete